MGIRTDPFHHSKIKTHSGMEADDTKTPLENERKRTEGDLQLLKLFGEEREAQGLHQGLVRHTPFRRKTAKRAAASCDFIGPGGPSRG